MNTSSILFNSYNKSNNFNTNLFELKQGDLLFGSIRPYLKKAGLSPINGALAGTVFSYKVIDDSYYNYVLFTITNDNFFKYAVANSKGTKMPVIGNNEILNYKVPFNSKIIRKFNELLDFKKIYIDLSNENKKLIEYRDFLIPLIMDGQVAINE